MSQTAEQLFWSRLNQNISSFCLEVTQSRLEPENRIVSSLVGEELEWCGSHSFLFMASRYLSTVRKIQEAELKLKVAESSLSSESQNVAQLRKQLKQAQLAAEDNDWQLQEQLAHASNLLHVEKETNVELKSKLALSQAKLVEVEMFLSSDNGAFALELEEALAAAKMKISELEAEKDELEMQMRRRGASDVGTGVGAARTGGGRGDEGKENHQAQAHVQAPHAHMGSLARKLAFPPPPSSSSSSSYGEVPRRGGFSLAGFASLLDE